MRAHRMAGYFRCGEKSIPGVHPGVVPRVAALRTSVARLPPTLRQVCTRPADYKQPLCRWRRFYPADRTGATLPPPELFPYLSAANSLSTSGRGVDVLLPHLRQGAVVRPQYDGTCPTCSARRSDTWRGPRRQTPQWRHRLPNRFFAHRSPPKAPSMPADKTRRKHKRVCQRSARLFRHRLITDVACCGSHDGPWETPFHPFLEYPVVWNCDCDCLEPPQPAQRPFATEDLPRYY
ncbi:hypothetical protein MOQ_006455 [Trypanosoma cruzi marinkellei]|uniref:Uncharacterized protein n=1 Tax=Trypanosoma cruzi marinkellei TaxID=85056 RepID=K2MRQ7_TRYCR|nr:hypothetical protein MOQ_006455 [Trypanosoma cruzi marinkellei]